MPAGEPPSARATTSSYMRSRNSPLSVDNPFLRAITAHWAMKARASGRRRMIGSASPGEARASASTGSAVSSAATCAASSGGWPASLRASATVGENLTAASWARSAAGVSMAPGAIGRPSSSGSGPIAASERSS